MTRTWSRLKLLSILPALLFFLESCGQTSGETAHGDTNSLSRDTGRTITSRFTVPEGFTRVGENKSSFGAYLRNLPLKPHGSDVHLYNGRVKWNQRAHAAVLDIDVSKRDLQQCADAVMRLRGEYLYKSGQYDKVHFNLTNGFRVDYSKWRKGRRVAVHGNSTSWVNKQSPSNTYKDFREYMEFVFMYAGTLSLSKELEPVLVEDIRVGDVFIRGGSPGHAVIVMDVAENAETGEKLFLLAQSYMPAQEIHILKNPKDKTLSPWYSSTFGSELVTPEWTFSRDELMRFAEE